MFVRKETVQYPEVDISSNATIAEKYKGSLMGMPENYRGILGVDLSLCTACQICQKTCPIDCIVIDNVKCDKTKLSLEDGSPVLNRFTQKEALKTRTVTRFDINAAKCMYCGLCEKACPTGAIQHTKKFEMNRESQEELILRFSVYLRGSADSSYYRDASSNRYVASGYIARGEYKTETKDFTAPAGYKELCMNINGQEECGFKQVSTSFAVDYIEDIEETIDGKKFIKKRAKSCQKQANL